MIPLKESNKAPKGVELYSRSQITLASLNFGPFKGSILYIGEYTLKGVI